MDDSSRTMMVTLAASVIKKGLITLGATAATHGIISSNQTETFVAAGMFLVGAGWSFWNDYGKAIVLSKLEVLKAQSLAQAAKLRSAGLPAPTVAEIAEQHPTLTAADVAKVTITVVKILLVAFVLSALLFPLSAMARSPRPRPAATLPVDVIQKIKDDLAKQNGNAQAIAQGTSTDPSISCDFKIFLGLTPQNLEAAIKKCISDGDSTLVDDTARALDSAKAFTPNPDQDAINCLRPGLAILKAGVIVRAVAAQPAVPATATAPEIPAVAAQPARSPGLILLFQKYREFVLAGGLTSCKTWVDTAVNATAGQAVGNAAGLVGAVALLAPK